VQDLRHKNAECDHQKNKCNRLSHVRGAGWVVIWQPDQPLALFEPSPCDKIPTDRYESVHRFDRAGSCRKGKTISSCCHNYNNIAVFVKFAGERYSK
jgi:hypothetical protein